MFELSRDPACITIFSSIDRHAGKLHEIHGSFLPYKNPYQTLYDVSYPKLKALTYQLFHGEWEERLRQSPKADTYRKIKASMKYEVYLDHGVRSERVTMTKLRTSDHKLMIEDMRKMRPKPPREERNCFMCHDMVEDEAHFLTECQLYGSYSHHWGGIQDQVPQIAALGNAQKFGYIMVQENPDVLKKVLRMVYKLTQFRKFMYETFYQQK